jgi:hypothetical protein
MHRSTHDQRWQPLGVAPDLLAAGLFKEGTLSSIDEEFLGVAFPDDVYFSLPNGFKGSLPTSMFMAKYTVAAGASVFAREDATATSKAVGWTAKKGNGEVIFLGTNPARIFRDASYYDATPAQIATTRALAQWAANEGGVQPILTVDEARSRAIARRVEASQGGGLLVFMTSRLSIATSSTLKLLDLATLGLDAKTTYTVTDLVTGTALGTATGADLQKGFAVPIEIYGTAVLRIK